MKIILMGYMGSGKTTVGKKVAQQLGLAFLDLDAYLEQAEGQRIAQLFQDKGEVYFRKREIHYLTEILTQQDDYVLSTGGGAPCFGDNMARMNQATPNTIYLKASIETLTDRLKRQREHRPLLSTASDEELQEYIAKHLFERSFFYNQAALKIAVDGKSPMEIAAEIKARLV